MRAAFLYAFGLASLGFAFTACKARDDRTSQAEEVRIQDPTDQVIYRSASAPNDPEPIFVRQLVNGNVIATVTFRKFLIAYNEGPLPKINGKEIPISQEGKMQLAEMKRQAEGELVAELEKLQLQLNDLVAVKNQIAPASSSIMQCSRTRTGTFEGQYAAACQRVSVAFEKALELSGAK